MAVVSMNTMPDPASLNPKYHSEIYDGRGVVIDDHNVVYQYFTTGITSLPTDYATRIQNFIAAYLLWQSQRGGVPVWLRGRWAA